jgi:Fe-S cluster assembly protein SufD
MIMEINPEIESFHALMDSYYRNMADPESLQKIKDRAWKRYLELGLPTRKSEVFRYVNLRRLFSQNYTPALPPKMTKDEIKPFIYPESQGTAIVFVNGYYQPHLSCLEALPKKAIILPMREAFKTYGSFLNNQWAKAMKEETDPFALLNAALHSEAAFVYLPPKTVFDTPLQIVNIIHTNAPAALALPRLHLFAGAQSQIELFSTLHTLECGNYFVNMVSEFALEEDAHVRYVQNAISGGEEQWFFDASRAVLKRNSTFKSVMAANGGAGTRHDYRISLTGENAEALLNGVWMLENKREAHVHVLMDHQAPNCHSMQLFKGVLNGTSKSSFEGKIYVRKEAQKTEAYQLNHNLLLSDKASAQSKPNLEIFADDVKATHGATVGQLDKEQLFYMKSRGFSDAAAKNLLIYGFCKEVIQQISLPTILNQVSDWTNNYLNKG